MYGIDFILLLLAFVCFFLAAINVQAGRVSLVPAGLALMVLAQLT